MRKISIIGSGSSLAKGLINYAIQQDAVQLSLYGVHDCDNEEFRTIKYRKIDFSDYDSLASIDYDCDQLYIFSGLKGASKGFNDYNRFIDVNEKNLLALLEMASKRKARCRIVYPSSRLVYKDSQYAYKENSELEGKSIYAINKIAAEQYIKAYGSVFDLSYSIFRIAIPFGSFNSLSSNYGIVSELNRQAKETGKILLYGGGHGKRTFVHIDDICKILYEAVELKDTENEIFNIGGCVYTVYQLAKFVSNRTGATIVSTKWPGIEGKVEVNNGWLDSGKLDSIFKITYKDIVNYI